MSRTKNTLWVLIVSLICACYSVADTPQLSASPDSLFFRQAGQTFQVAVSARNATLGAWTAAAASTGNWLTVSPASGSGAGMVTVSANTASLAQGEYSGTVTISATGFTSAVVKVELELEGNGGGPGGPPSMLLVRPGALQFRAFLGGSAPKSQELDIFNPAGAASSWTLTTSVTTPAGGKWLKTSATSGTGKSTVDVSVDPTGLATGEYAAKITVVSGTSQASVAVSLRVDAAQPAHLVIDPRAFNFIVDPMNSTQPPAAKIMNVKNAGGGTLSWTATSTVTSPTGGKWLSITPASGTGEGTISIKADPTGLSAGMYSGTVTVKAGSDTAQALVFLRIVGPDKPVVVVSPRAITFTATGGTASPASRTINVSSKATGLTYAATASTAKGGDWLKITGASGAVPGTITATATPGTLAPGVYTGSIAVKISGATQETKNVTVALKVFGPNDAARLEVEPAAVAFTAVKGGSNPSAKTVKLEPEGITSLAWTAAATTASGGSWLSVSPTSGTTTATANSSLSISVTLGTLNTGNYTGTVVVTPAASSNVPPVSIRVMLVVSATAGAHQNGSQVDFASPAAGAAAGPLLALFTQPSDHFISESDLPLNVSVTVLDSSGAPVEGANVVVSSSNTEPDMVLTDLGGGQYAGVFRALGSGTLTLSGSAQADAQASSAFTVSGDVQSGVSQQAIVFQNGAVSAASVSLAASAPVAPGSLLSVFGLGIAGSGGGAPGGAALPSSLNGVSVKIGGFDAALVTATPGAMDQINLQVPFEVNGAAQADIVVNNNGVISVPETITIGNAPALFTMSQDGTGDGAFLHSDNITMISAGSPAHSGETIVLYATGFGPVSPAVQTGALASGTTSIAGNVVVSIGGQIAVVQYAGLAPGFAGLYQLNVVVPSGISGDVPVVVSVDGTPATGQATVPIN